MIAIGNQEINDLSDLSPRSQLILNLIPQAKAWLQWAVSGNMEYTSPSEEYFLQMVLEGLHDDHFIRFKGFRTGINRLLQLPTETLEELSALEEKTGSTSSLEQTLSKNNLVSYRKLEHVDLYLENQGLAKKTVFASPTFGEKLLLHRHINNIGSLDPKRCQQAAAFAAKQAFNIPEFVHYFGFFIHGTTNLETASPEQDIPQLASELIDITFSLIQTPTAGGYANEPQLRQKLPETIKKAPYIGFTTCAPAMNNLVRNLPMKGQSRKAVKEAIEHYMTGVKRALEGLEVPVGQYSQTGDMITYEFRTSNLEAQLNVDPFGNLSLGADTRRS